MDGMIFSLVGYDGITLYIIILVASLLVVLGAGNSNIFTGFTLIAAISMFVSSTFGSEWFFIFSQGFWIVLMLYGMYDYLIEAANRKGHKSIK